MHSHRVSPPYAIALALFGLLLAAYVPEVHADVLVIGGSCSLGDAIEAANTDQVTVGGCVDTATGPDTLVLDVDTVLAAADFVRSTELRGAFAGLPDIATEITIQAGLGSIIERDAGFDCDQDDPPDEFRLLQVTSVGNLTLDGVVLENGCADNGGALLVEGGTLQVVDAIFRGHTARLSGGSEGGALWIGNASVVSVSGSTFEGNRVISSSGNASGGALRVAHGASVEISGSTFDDNLAEGGESGEGGALRDEGGVTSLSSSRFLRNRARGALDAFGGAVFVNSTTTLTGLVFDGNIAQGGDQPGFQGARAEGGGLFVEFNAFGAVLSDSVFRNNIAQGGAGDRGGNAQGGGLQNDARITISRVTFSDNQALGGRGEAQAGGHAVGGGVFACEIEEASHVTYSGNLAWGGDSTLAAGGDARGGGHHVDCGPHLLRHATFTGNRAVAGVGGAADGVAEGGGLLANDGIFVESSILESNSTTTGGVTTASDCANRGAPYVTSLGYNVVGAPGNCNFGETGDQTGVAASLLPIGDHGCTTLVSDGTCLPTHPVDLGTPAQDAGSCTASGATADARGLSRPWDGAPANADDGCDVGAYEARDEDEGVGDGVEDGVDNCPADLNPGQEDADHDGLGNVCDLCFGDNSTGDADGDGVCANLDCDDGDPTNACAPIFDDGFESGDTSAWSSSIP